MKKLTLLFLGLLTLAGTTVLRAQTPLTSAPYVYVMDIPDTLKVPIDIYDRAGGYARTLAMGAGGFGLINSTGNTVQGAAVGMQSYFANPFLVDPIDVVTNPAWVTHYKGTATVDLDPMYASVNFGVTPDLALGLMLAKKSFPGLANVSTQDNLLARVTSPSEQNLSNVTGLDNTMYLFGALDLAGTSVGLGVSYTSAGYDNTGAENTQATSTESLSQLGIDLGVLAALGSDAKLDAALTLLFPSYSYTFSQTVGTTNTTSSLKDSKTIIGVNARAMLNTSSNLIWIPMVDFYTMSGTTTNATHAIKNIPDTSTSTSAPGRTSIDVGFGTNYIVGDLLLEGGISLGIYSETISGTSPSPDFKTTQFIFPRWNLGAEYRVLRHVKIRLGYAVSNGSQNSPGSLSADKKSVGTIAQTVRDTYFSPSGNTGGMSIGAGYVYDKFFADFAVTNLSTSAFNFTNGKTTSGSGIMFSFQLGFVFGAEPKS